ncbi:MAG TPA: hypothetical protein VLE99_05555 [Candidatus Saccharimonadales bacterium]|nr:hypothetical protein [Candidatus Saccharimonadales bacterium]
MAKTKNQRTAELDGVYVLKLVLYMLLGSLWLKIHRADLTTGVPIPVGLIVGLLFTSHEHFQIDRKIEYAVLILAALIGLIAPYGLFIGL